MANTYTLISSNVLASSAASVTFSSIPATYTDLVVRYSSASSYSGTSSIIIISYNGTTTGSTLYSWIRLRGNGTAASSALTSSSYYNAGISNASTATSNVFSNGELYIPNYTSSGTIPVSTFHASENNATTANIEAYANLYRGSGAITSITLTDGNSSNLISGSSFYLYGIKKS